ncbi:FeoB-associated Cys-rich membrane protein [uncultured Ruthenibacterium sp.]
MGFADWLILAFVAVLFVLAVRRIVRDRRNGKCCGNCAGCSHVCNQKKL